MYFTISYNVTNSGITHSRQLIRRWTTLFPLEKLLLEWNGYLDGTRNIPGYTINNGCLYSDNETKVQEFDNQQPTIDGERHIITNKRELMAVLAKMMEERQKLASKQVVSVVIDRHPVSPASAR